MASALQVVILFCWAVAAKPWEQSSRPIINKGTRNIFMEFSPCRRTEEHGLALKCRQGLLHIPASDQSVDNGRPSTFWLC
ncbi:hypothetical protein D3C73_657240 [compost metagenome]